MRADLVGWMQFHEAQHLHATPKRDGNNSSAPSIAYAIAYTVTEPIAATCGRNIDPAADRQGWHIL